MGILGDRLRASREAKGWTQVYVAKIIDITSQALSNYERSDRDPDTPLLKQLAELYEVSTDYLLGLTNDPSPRPKIETDSAGNLAKDIESLSPRDRNAMETLLDALKGTDEDIGPEVMAAHRTDDPMDDLPEEALKSIAKLKQKYIEETNKQKK